MAKRAAATSQRTLVEDPPAPAAETSTRLRLHRLTVKGYAGFGPEPQTFDFGAGVTVITGQNASGKSSILAALRCVLGIERVAASRRAHVEGPAGDRLVPEIEAWLQGDDREVHVRRRGDGSPEVKERIGEDWREVPRAAEFLRDLIDAQGAVPAGFIGASNDDRATMLLEALDLPGYSRDEAMARAGLQSFRLPPVPAGLHPLEDIEQVIKAVASARTEVGRQQDTEAQAAKKLLAGLPAQAPGDVSAAVAELDRLVDERGRALAAAEVAADAQERRLLAEAKGAFEAIEASTTANFKRAAADLRAKHETVAAEIRAEAERKVAADLAATNAAIEGLKESGEADLEAAATMREAAEAAARRQREEARQEHAADQANLAADRENLVALRTQQQAAETDRHVRATAKEATDKAAAHAARYEALSEGIAGLRRYAVELAGTLPIRGLEVRYDEKGKRVVTLDGIDLVEINDAKMLELADQVAALHIAARGTSRAYLPLILVDWMERVDESRRGPHLRGLAERGAQVVAAVVGEGPLQVLQDEAALKGEAA